MEVMQETLEALDVYKRQIADSDVKYGLSVMGTVHPKHIYSNNTGQPSDVLILTKKLGVGLVCNANRVGVAPLGAIEAVSYTHLDVYKRQGHCEAAESGAFGGTASKMHPSPVKEGKIEVIACLLYTSCHTLYNCAPIRHCFTKGHLAPYGSRIVCLKRYHPMSCPVQSVDDAGRKVSCTAAYD